MTAMEMVGTFKDPSGVSRNFTLTTNPDQLVRGEIRQQVAGQDFPADSHFDMFVELVVPISGTLVERARNFTSARVHAPIDCIPPREEAALDGMLRSPMLKVGLREFRKVTHSVIERYLEATVRLTSNITGLPYADLIQITHRPFFVEPVPPQC
jgi:hypothetical protein